MSAIAHVTIRTIAYKNIFFLHRPVEMRRNAEQRVTVYKKSRMKIKINYRLKLHARPCMNGRLKFTEKKKGKKDKNYNNDLVHVCLRKKKKKKR